MASRSASPSGGSPARRSGSSSRATRSSTRSNARPASTRMLCAASSANGVRPCRKAKVRAVTRLSHYLFPTVKEAPADAEALSHKLLVRAGLIRQVASGFWTFMPAGWRSHRKVEQIIREEMDAIGGQEMLMPVVLPAELWRQTGRYEIDELFKLKDRRAADFVLAMTHE